jgi:hypothetical protein
VFEHGDLLAERENFKSGIGSSPKENADCGQD